MRARNKTDQISTATADTQNVGVILVAGVILQAPKKTSLNVVDRESFYPSAVRRSVHLIGLPYILYIFIIIF